MYSTNSGPGDQAGCQTAGNDSTGEGEASFDATGIDSTGEGEQPAEGFPDSLAGVKDRTPVAVEPS